MPNIAKNLERIAEALEHQNDILTQGNKLHDIMEHMNENYNMTCGEFLEEMKDKSNG